MFAISRDYFEKTATFFIALSIPLLFFGRAPLGVSAGISLLCLLCVIRKEDYLAFYAVLKASPLTFLVGITLLSWIPNLFNSLFMKHSLEVFVRTPLLLLGITAVLYFCRSRSLLMLNTLAIGVIIVALIGIYGYFFDISFVQFLKNKPELTTTTLEVEMKSLGNAFALVASLFVFFILRSKNKFWKSIYGLAVGLSLFVILVSHAKAALAAIVAAALVFSFFMIFKIRNKTYFFSVFGALMILIVAVLYFLIISTYSASTENADLVSLPVWLVDTHRQIIWSYSLDKIAEAPWYGYGLNASNYLPDSTMTVTEYTHGLYSHEEAFRVLVFPGHPHNWILEILLEAGVIPGLIFIAVVCAILWMNVKSYLRTQHPALLCSLCVSAAYWGSSLFNFSYWSTWWQASYYICVLLGYFVYFHDHEARILKEEGM